MTFHAWAHTSSRGSRFPPFSQKASGKQAHLFNDVIWVMMWHNTCGLNGILDSFDGGSSSPENRSLNIKTTSFWIGVAMAVIPSSAQSFLRCQCFRFGTCCLDTSAKRFRGWHVHLHQEDLASPGILSVFITEWVLLRYNTFHSDWLFCQRWKSSSVLKSCTRAQTFSLFYITRASQILAYCYFHIMAFKGIGL